MPALSVLIPSRNEEWLQRTIDDVLAHRRADTEVIVVLDGAWPAEPLHDHPDLHIIHRSVSTGQRASVNEAARLSMARYVMKLDAHCAVSEGFDVELIRAAGELGEDVTQIPRQYNLHIYDWECLACGHLKDHGPMPDSCERCNQNKGFRQQIVWTKRRQTDYWRFDGEPRFQYWGAYGERPEAQGEITDVMTSLGACFFMSRARFWALGGLDEACGSWGSFGIEVALKSWLSGGRHVVNKRAWFAHFFRVGGLSFPYPISGEQQEAARSYTRRVWFSNTWPGQVRPLSWLIDKFWPVPGWSEEQYAEARRKGDELVARSRKKPTTGILVYTDSCLSDDIWEPVRRRLKAVGLPIVSVSLKPLDFGRNIVLDKERGILTMFEQILAGLEAIDTDIVFFCEHDVLYHPSHFEFTPPRPDMYYYNVNTWKVNSETGHAVTYLTKQTSGLCAYRDVLLAHYRARVERVKATGYSTRIGFEPGSHGRAERIDDVPSETWRSEWPNIDIRHGKNLTRSRWKREEFRDRRNCQEWQESDVIPGWGAWKDIQVTHRG